MSPALRVEQSRSWWSLSSKSSKKDLHADNDKTVSKNSGRNFPSFSSFIGRKSKKHPTLPIEEPPSPLQSPSTSRTHRDSSSQFQTDLQGEFPLRSPLSPAESVEPLTPVDSFREEQRSLLTSDHGLFGIRGLVARGPTSPSALSTHSNASFLDVCSRPGKSVLYFRSSCSSSSSISHSTHEFQSRDFAKVHDANVEAQMLSSSPMSNTERNASSVDPELVLPTSKPNSFPPTRLRGMTQSGSRRSPLSQEAYATVRQRYLSSPGNRPLASRGATSPLVPSWVPESQLSSCPSNRPSSGGCISPNQLAMTQPPSAPPTHELPPRPSTARSPSSEKRWGSQPNYSSSSSSSISFASTVPSNKELVAAFDQTKEQNSDTENRSFVTDLQLEPEAVDNLIPSASGPLAELTHFPRAQKQVPLHCSTSKHPPSVQSPTSAPPLEAPQILRKSKSHHRFEHEHTVSINSPSSQLHEPPTQDPRRGSTLSRTSISASVSVLPKRQRVFSGSNSRRPSTSSGADAHGTRMDLKIPSNASPSKPWPANMLALRSFWEDRPSSPTHLSQPIMSPNLLTQMEADPEDRSSLSTLPPPSIPLDCRQERTMPAPIVSSCRDSEVSSFNISSQSLSEVSKTPQLSPKSVKSITVPMIENGNQLGTSVGRTTSMVAARSSTVLQLSRRPATASGTTSSGPLVPMPTMHEKKVPRNSRPSPIDTRSPALSGMTPSTPTSPLNLRRSQQEGFNASNAKPAPPQLRSLPPPPRPRAKAEAVTAIGQPPEGLWQGNGRVKNSIGVDFGPGQRRVVSPSIQSNTYHPPSQQIVQVPTFGTDPVPPRTLSRPLIPSSRHPELCNGVQSIPTQKLPSNIIPPNGAQKLSRRISLQRKPSFLDIDRDDDMETDGILDFHSMKSTSCGTVSFSHTISAAESFLELGRESFDTIRVQNSVLSSSKS